MDQQKITILYCRLSNEDAQDGESNSIANQRSVLTRFAQEQGFTNTRVLVDDGYTGTNFNRPGVLEGLALVEQDRVGCWIVKDMSRFGRDYLQVGQYTELVFPSHNVRFIAVNDGVDSEKGDSDFTPFRNLFNDFYAKDTSKKVRAIMRARGTSGRHIGKAPYGYRDDPDNRGYWLLDEEAAKVVKRIFDLTIDGKGPSKVARTLREERVPTVRCHYAQMQGKPFPMKPYNWDDSSVVGILERMEYIGCTCNFKTYSKSYKLKKRIANTVDDMVIVLNTQEAIVSKEQWERAQELRKCRRRMTKAERQGVFSGLLFCADCGSVLHFGTCKSFEGKQDRYVCAKYKSGSGECSAHYIREDVLRELVLERIRAVSAYVREDAEAFQEEWLQCRRDEQEQSMREDTKRVAVIQKRLDDIDQLLTRIYEDSVLGNLSQERYQKMQRDYEAEQERLKLEQNVLSESIKQQKERADDCDQFHALVEKYVDVPELTPTIVNEYIKRIIVHEPDKSSGHRVQRIQIVFNFLEDANLPLISEPVACQAKHSKEKTA